MPLAVTSNRQSLPGYQQSSPASTSIPTTHCPRYGEGGRTNRSIWKVGIGCGKAVIVRLSPSDSVVRPQTQTLSPGSTVLSISQRGPTLPSSNVDPSPRTASTKLLLFSSRYEHASPGSRRSPTAHSYWISMGTLVGVGGGGVDVGAKGTGVPARTTGACVTVSGTRVASCVVFVTPGTVSAVGVCASSIRVHPNRPNNITRATAGITMDFIPTFSPSIPVAILLRPRINQILHGGL